MNVGQWLKSIGLARYEKTFSDNEVDETVLAKLTGDDLKDMGVVAVGHRRKLLDAIEALKSRSAAEPQTQGQGAERRHLTVMFVDLVGSTQLSTKLDPEDMRSVILAYQQCVTGEIRRLGGNVAKYMGDGVLAYFGWPTAHENEAERAVRAGLAISASMPGLQDPLGSPLSARIGIATGLVVVGDLIGAGAAQESAVVGDTPNLAARLQSFAEPGQVVVSEVTHRLLAGMFETRDLGTPTLKGIAEPAHAFAVTAERALESRFAARNPDSMTALVGREREIAELRQKWTLSIAGEGQCVLVTGEAGIGKSRVVEALFAALSGTQHRLVRYQCSPHHANSPLYPVISQLERASGFAAADSSETRLAKLTAALSGLDAEEIALVAASMNVGPPQTLNLSPQQQRFKTLNALVRQVGPRDATHPVLIVLEDAHWIDPSTLEFLTLCLDHFARQPVMLVITARLPFHGNLPAHPLVTQLVLNRLSRTDIQALAASMDGGTALPPGLLEDVTAKSDGIPLYIEEMIRAATEHNPERQSGGVPASLHDSLMSRLDRLHTARETAQIASVIGRAFDYRTLAAITPLQDSALATDLETLTSGELVFRQGMIPDASFLFRHALIRDAAYESLLRARRQSLHARLLETFEARGSTAPELLALHASAANLPGKALAYWSSAGDAAMTRPAYQEAISHYTQAVALATCQPELELELGTRLGLASISAKGHSHDDTCAVFNACQSLAQKVQRPDLTYVTWYGLWCAHHVRSEISQAEASSQNLLETGTRIGQSSHLLMGLRARAITSLMSGNAVESLRLHDEAMALHHPERDRDFVRVTGQDLSVSRKSYYAITLWVLGRSLEAWSEATGSITLAKQTGHVNSLGYAYMHAALLSILDRRQEGPALVSEMLAFTAEHHLAMWHEYARQFQAVNQLAADAGGAFDAFTQARQSLSARNAHLFSGTLALEAADRLMNVGHADKAASCIVEAASHIERTGERFPEPELHRLKGRLQPPEAARSSQDQALKMARDRSAIAWVHRCNGMA